MIPFKVLGILLLCLFLVIADNSVENPVKEQDEIRAIVNHLNENANSTYIFKEGQFVNSQAKVRIYIYFHDHYFLFIKKNPQCKFYEIPIKFKINVHTICKCSLSQWSGNLLWNENNCGFYLLLKWVVMWLRFKINGFRCKK